MTYISLLDKTRDLLEMLEDNSISIQELIEQIFYNELTMKDIDKANKVIIKKYGKKNITIHKFPVIPNCEYAYTAHSNCLCLYTYVRPKF